MEGVSKFSKQVQENITQASKDAYEQAGKLAESAINVISETELAKMAATTAASVATSVYTIYDQYMNQQSPE